MKLKTNNKGLGLVEILVVLSVIIVAFTAILQLYKLQIQTERAKRDDLGVYALLSESLEAVRSIRDDNWTNLSSLTMGTDYYTIISGGAWSLSSTDPGPINGFSRWVVLNSVRRDINDDIVSSGGSIDSDSSGGSIDSDTLRITANAEWPRRNTTSTRSLSTYLTNWQGKL